MVPAAKPFEACVPRRRSKWLALLAWGDPCACSIGVSVGPPVRDLHGGLTPTRPPCPRLADGRPSPRSPSPSSGTASSPRRSRRSTHARSSAGAGRGGRRRGRPRERLDAADSIGAPACPLQPPLAREARLAPARAAGRLRSAGRLRCPSPSPSSPPWHGRLEHEPSPWPPAAACCAWTSPADVELARRPGARRVAPAAGFRLSPGGDPPWFPPIGDGAVREPRHGSLTAGPRRPLPSAPRARSAWSSTSPSIPHPRSSCCGSMPSGSRWAVRCPTWATSTTAPATRCVSCRRPDARGSAEREPGATASSCAPARGRAQPRLGRPRARGAVASLLRRPARPLPRHARGYRAALRARSPGPPARLDEVVIAGGSMARAAGGRGARRRARPSGRPLRACRGLRLAGRRCSRSRGSGHARGARVAERYEPRPEPHRRRPTHALRRAPARARRAHDGAA